MITPSDLSAIAGAVAYGASVITHLGIIKYNKKAGPNVNLSDIENDVKTLLGKVQSVDKDAVNDVSGLTTNPATSGIVSALTDAAKTELPAPVYNAIGDLLSALKDFAAKPASTPAPVATAPASPDTAPASSPVTAPVSAPAAPPAAPVEQSAAKLMGLPQ